MDLKTAIVMVRNALETLEMKATKDNLQKMMGCMNMLDAVLVALNENSKKEAANNDGNGQGENIPG